MRLKFACFCLCLAAAAALMVAVTGCENDNDLSGNEMYITPSSYRFGRTNDLVVSFGVHGAVPPVQWSVSDTALGIITGVSSNNNAATAANYERKRGKWGVNTVIVRDARGWQASASVIVKEGL